MKTTNITFTALSIVLMTVNTVMGASYDTLPKGVSTVVFKQVMANNIESKFNDRGEKESINLKEEFSSSRLEELSSIIKGYFDELKSLSPNGYNNFSLGEYSTEIKADLTAQGLGYGRGITDRLTVYGSLPFYHIKTDVRIIQSKKSTISDVQNDVQYRPTNSVLSKFVQDLTMQLPNSSAELLQSFVVNYYGYKPIGKWEKSALGDAEIGFIYRLTDFDNMGASLSSGLVLPTGDADDPDSLQDVATGDGQYDTFLEVAAGMDVYQKLIQVDLKSRYTYQFASDKVVRTYDDADMPLSKVKSKVNEKLGNKFDTTLTVTYNYNDWLNFHTAYILNTTSKASYSNLNDLKIKDALEAYSTNEANWVKIGANFSTVNLYRQNKFFMPFEVGVSVQRLLDAKNLNGYDRIDFDFRMYF